MNPWADRRRRDKNSETGNAFTFTPSPQYPSCAKEERKCLNELNRAGGGDLPSNFVLSNGMMATDFCLEYITKHHFKRKSSSSKSQLNARTLPILTPP